MLSAFAPVFPDFSNEPLGGAMGFTNDLRNFHRVDTTSSGHKSLFLKVNNLFIHCLPGLFLLTGFNQFNHGLELTDLTCTQRAV